MITDRLNKHDQYLESLVLKLKRKYDFVYTNIPLKGKRGRLIGEIDILCIKNGKVTIYEVKCSYRIYKAKKQLYKIKKNLDMKVDELVFFCGNANVAVSV